MDYLLGVWNGSSHEPQPKRQAGGDFLDTGIPSSWQSFFSQDLSELNQAELQRVSRQSAGFEKCYGKSIVSQLWKCHGKAMPSFDERRAELIYFGARQTQSRHWQPSRCVGVGNVRVADSSRPI